MRIGIVAGEASGDLLGAGLLRALRERVPDLEAVGVGGPQMQAAGCRSLYPMERLAVMGFGPEVMARLWELYRMRADLARRLIHDPPDLFVAIDAPDFNLGLEGRLRAAGIRTVHYVSPTVWAWRRYRLRKIAQGVDLMLTLFPFEAEFFREHGVPVTFVGHPLADAIPLESDADAARDALGLSGPAEVVALLPGSRVGEVRRLGPAFIEAASLCRRRRPGLRFVAPMAGARVRREFEAIVADHPDAPQVTLADGSAQRVMTAADVVLAAGGTATLEAMLLKRPVVMAYRAGALSYRLARRLVKIGTYSLPNLLAGERVIPELIQEEVTAPALAEAVLAWLEAPERVAELRRTFTRLHLELRQGADMRAAEAVLSMLPGRLAQKPAPMQG